MLIFRCQHHITDNLQLHISGNFRLFYLQICPIVSFMYLSRLATFHLDHQKHALFLCMPHSRVIFVLIFSIVCFCYIFFFFRDLIQCYQCFNLSIFFLFFLKYKFLSFIFQLSHFLLLGKFHVLSFGNTVCAHCFSMYLINTLQHSFILLDIVPLALSLLSFTLFSAGYFCLQYEI